MSTHPLCLYGYYATSVLKLSSHDSLLAVCYGNNSLVSTPPPLSFLFPLSMEKQS